MRSVWNRLHRAKHQWRGSDGPTAGAPTRRVRNPRTVRWIIRTACGLMRRRSRGVRRSSARRADRSRCGQHASRRAPRRRGARGYVAAIRRAPAGSPRRDGLTRLAGAISILFAVAAPTNAETIRLHCKASDGTPSADLLIDLPARRFKWGVINYEITNETDRYITGTQIDAGIGGEIFVLDRVSGDVQRATVYMECTDQSCGTTKLTARTFYGKCGRSMF